LARFVRGDLVVVPFPLADKPGTKRRPALIVASWSVENSTDYLACMIAAEPAHDPHFMELAPSDLATGSLNHTRYLRPSYLFPVDEALVTRRIGTLTPEKLDAVLSTLAALFR
jgi:mRNA interferase MazF